MSNASPWVRWHTLCPHEAQSRALDVKANPEDIKALREWITMGHMLGMEGAKHWEDFLKQTGQMK